MEETSGLLNRENYYSPEKERILLEFKAETNKLQNLLKRENIPNLFWQGLEAATRQLGFLNKTFSVLPSNSEASSYPSPVVQDNTEKRKRTDEPKTLEISEDQILERPKKSRRIEITNLIEAEGEKEVASEEQILAKKLDPSKLSITKTLSISSTPLKILPCPNGDIYVFYSTTRGKATFYYVDLYRKNLISNENFGFSDSKIEDIALVGNNFAVLASFPLQIDLYFDSKLEISLKSFLSPPTKAVANKNIMLVGLHDGSLVKWDNEKKEIIDTNKGHYNRVTALAMNDHYVVSGSSDKMVMISEVGSFAKHHKIKIMPLTVTALALSFDSSIVYAGCLKGTVAAINLNERSVPFENNFGEDVLGIFPDEKGFFVVTASKITFVTKDYNEIITIPFLEKITAAVRSAENLIIGTDKGSVHFMS